MVPGSFHVEFPNYYRNPWGFTNPEDVDAECIRQMELILQREPEMAAVIGEPISAKPAIPYQRILGKKVKKLCEQYGSLLIFDEIIEGFGRTGKMFAMEHFGVIPDIMALAKGIASGMPLGALVARGEIMD